MSTNIIAACAMLMLGLTCTGCGGGKVETHAVLASAKLDQVVLLDVQGLWGGRDLWISKVGAAVCRTVLHPMPGQNGMQEVRYEFTVSVKQAKTLAELIKRHHILAVTTTDRYGQPDEARPIICLKLGGRTRTVGKWANDKHSDFDPIYQALLVIAESGLTGKQASTGPYQSDWHPEGFPDNHALWEMTAPKIGK